MHLRKLPSGSWQASVKVGGRRATVTRRLRREAVDAGEKLRRRLAGETGEIWTNPTIGDAVSERVRTATWSPTLTAEYIRAQDRLPDHFTERRLDSITVPIVERLYAELATKRKVGPYAVRRVHELLRSTFTEAVRVGAIDASPMTQVRPPAKPERDVHPPSPDQVRAILAACDGAARVAFTISATTGLRRGELAAIRWADVDLDESRISVTRSHAYTPVDGVHERPTKTGKRGQRTVSINADTIALLRSWRAAQCEAALAAQGERPMWVFSDDGATPWRPDRFTHEFDAARKAAKVTGVRLHDLRHYVATRLLSAGAPVDRVAAMLGHTSSATTLEVYRHWIPGEDRDLADLIGRITASG